MSSETSRTSSDYRDDVLDHLCPVCGVGPGALCVGVGRSAKAGRVLLHPHADRDPKVRRYYAEWRYVEKFLEEIGYLRSSWGKLIDHLSCHKDRVALVMFLREHPGLWRKDAS